MSEAAAISSLVDWRTCDRHVIRGLDHLGVSAFSIAVYNILLPGITNVTDRARYFSFYPWIIHTYAHDARTDDRQRWLTWYRRLDYAYALASTAADLHDQGSARGVVGADRARAQLRNAPDTTHCDLHAADLNNDGKVPAGAYFKNPQGGYGQYYKAVLHSLGVFIENDNEKCMYPDMQLTTYAGLPLAASVEAQAPFKQLREIALAQGASVSDLADLGARVGPSAIEAGSDEHRLLCSLFWGEDEAICKAQTLESREWRRSTLHALLSFVNAIGPEADEAVAKYRWACASQSLERKSDWQPPLGLAPIVRGWADYHWNELFNYALETLLWATVQVLRENPRSVSDVAHDLVTKSMSAPGGHKLLGDTMSNFIENTMTGLAGSPPSNNGDLPASQLEEVIADAIHEKNLEVATAEAFRLLGHLASVPTEAQVQLFITLPGAAELLGSHPIHLQAWRRRVAVAGEERVDKFLEQLVIDWIVHRHLRVAVRKLASQGVHTFKFAPEEDRLVCLTDEELTPGPTNPRLRQGIQILADLGYLIEHEGRLMLSSTGSERLGVER